MRTDDVTRTCGECSLCCKLLGVPELRKPAGKWCDHAKPGRPGGACSVQATDARPAACSVFRCLWLDGLGDERARPDRLGAVLLPTMPREGVSQGVAVYLNDGIAPDRGLLATVVRVLTRDPGTWAVIRKPDGRSAYVGDRRVLRSVAEAARQAVAGSKPPDLEELDKHLADGGVVE